MLYSTSWPFRWYACMVYSILCPFSWLWFLITVVFELMKKEFLVKNERVKKWRGLIIIRTYGLHFRRESFNTFFQIWFKSKFDLMLSCNANQEFSEFFLSLWKIWREMNIACCLDLHDLFKDQSFPRFYPTCTEKSAGNFDL